MELIARKCGSQARDDALTCVRADGTRTAVALPRQRILPHDLVHAVVESALGFSDGFIGLIAKGAEIGFLNATFTDYIDPARHGEVAQAESAVESMQAQLWNDAFDAEAFEYGMQHACAMRGVPTPAHLSARQWNEVFERIRALGGQWEALPAGDELRLGFPLDAVGPAAQAGLPGPVFDARADSSRRQPAR
ncbi:MAG: hypothetical protein KDJ14_11825 [Xanthomonadales bacterium]|nr:hypothetical protein [Xanthomonadales bacterium]